MRGVRTRGKQCVGLDGEGVQSRIPRNRGLSDRHTSQVLRDVGRHPWNTGNTRIKTAFQLLPLAAAPASSLETASRYGSGIIPCIALPYRVERRLETGDLMPTPLPRRTNLQRKAAAPQRNMFLHSSHVRTAARQKSSGRTTGSFPTYNSHCSSPPPTGNCLACVDTLPHLVLLPSRTSHEAVPAADVSWNTDKPSIF